MLNREPWYRSSRLHEVGLIVLFAGLYLPLLGTGSLAAFDEGTYAEVARQCTRGHWIVLHHGSEPWNTDKPPLAIWMQALAMLLFGDNEFAVRLPAALCGMALVWVTYRLARRIAGSWGGLLAALAIGTTPHLAGFSVSGMHDVPLTLCTTVAMYCGYLGFVERRTAYQGWAVVWIALGVMVKSVSGLLPVFAFGVWFLLTRQWRCLAWWPLGWGVLVWMAIVLPWHIAFAIAKPDDFLNLYLGFTIKQRLVEGFYVIGDIPFLSVLANFNLGHPLLPLGLAAAIWLLGKVYADRNSTSLFLFSWFFTFAALVVLSRTQSHHYAMPVYPAIAVMVGAFGVAFIRQPWQWAGLVVLGIGLTFFSWTVLRTKPTPSPLVNGLLVAGIVTLFATWHRSPADETDEGNSWPSYPWLQTVAIALLLFGPLLYNLKSFRPVDGSEGIKELAAQTRENLKPEDRLAAYLVTYLTPTYYFDRQVSWILDRSQILNEWLLSERKGYVITNQRGLESIGAGNYTEVARADDRFLIVNPEGKGAEPAIYPVDFEFHPGESIYYVLDSRGRVTFPDGTQSEAIARTDEIAVDLEVYPDPISLIVMTNRGRFVTVRGNMTLPDMPEGNVEYVDFEFSPTGGYVVLDRTGRVIGGGGAETFGFEEAIWGEVPVDLEFNPNGGGYLILYSYGTIRGFGTDRDYLSPPTFGWDAMADLVRYEDGRAIRLDKFGGLHGERVTEVSPYYGSQNRHRAVQLSPDAGCYLLADGYGVFQAMKR